MKATEIKKCGCAHKAQDQMHGAGMRVHNPLAKQKDKPQIWRCSVCGSEK